MPNHDPTIGGHNRGADKSQSTGSQGANSLDQSLANGQTDYPIDPFGVPGANMPSSTSTEPSATPVTPEPHLAAGNIDLATASLSETPKTPTPEPAGAMPPPEPPHSTTVAAGAEGGDPKNNNDRSGPETPRSPTSTPPTAEDFRKEMVWERHGYRPVAYFRTVEEARASGRDLDKLETYVSVKASGFTKEELAALPNDAKQKNYYIGFAKQLLDSSEGVFTKKFWTSFEGIKKVLTAGIIKGEVEEVGLGAAEWLLSKRSGGAQAAPASPEESAAKEAPSTPTPGTPSGTPAPEASAAPKTENAKPATDPVNVEGSKVETPVEASEIVQTPPAPTPEKSARAADAPNFDAEVIPNTGTTPAPEASGAPEARNAGPMKEPVRMGWTTEGSPVVATEVAQTPPTPTPETPTRTADAPSSDAQVITQPTATTDKKERTLEAKTLEIAALQEIEKRIQEKLETLRDRIIPETVTVRLDDPKSAQMVRQLQRYGEGFNAGFAAQVSKVHDALEAVGQMGLDQPQQAIVFKRKQEEALALVDSLTFGHDELNKMAKDIKVSKGNKLPDSMKEAMNNASDILEGIKSDLDEAQRLVATARRVNPNQKAEQEGGSPSGAEPKVEVKTGSVASIPRLGKELTIDPRTLEMMGHAMVDANIPDKDLNGWYKMVMSEFVKSYVGTFSKIRREIYESRMDGSNMNEMQKEKFRFLAEELGQPVQVSDLVQLDYSKFSLPYTEELDSRFRSVIDRSKFQKALNEMKAQFATALNKELDKVPGTENTATTYVAFKRDKFEKSGITDFFAKN